MSTLAPPVQSGLRFQFEVTREELPKRKHRFFLWLNDLRSRMPDETVSFVTSLCVHVLLVMILALISTSLNVGLRPIVLTISDSESSVESLVLASLDTPWINQEQDEAENAEQKVDKFKLTVNEPSLTLAEVVSPASMSESVPKTWLPAELVSAEGNSSPHRSNANSSTLFASSSLEG